MQTTPWVEKYRPSTLNDTVLSDENRIIFQNILNRSSTFPNLLFYGPPGTGKTTSIIALINEYNSIHNVDTYAVKNNTMMLNSSDDRGVEIIRSNVLVFLRSQNVFSSGTKFVILDEVDYMTKNAQQALKYLLQTCTQNVRFCLICNYISKIEESLQNEFICVRFNQLPKPAIYGFMERISDAEGLGLTRDAIETITTMFSSDIRSMINFIQVSSSCSGRGVEGWDRKILNRANMVELEGILRGEATVAEVKRAIYDMGVQYNIDTKSIFIKFVHYLVEKGAYDGELLDMVGDILHHGDVKTETWLEFFVCGFRRLCGGVGGCGV